MHTVKTITQTCFACPSQWEGQTTNGDSIYVRHRWGTLRVDLNGKTVLSKDVGDGLSGVMNLDEVKRHTRPLFDWADCVVEPGDDEW
jgi:hypothetical protein